MPRHLRLGLMLGAALLPPFFVSATETAPGPDDLDRSFRAGYFYAASLAASRQGHELEALLLLRRASSEDPGSLFLLRELAESEEAADRQEEAAEALRKALKLDPNNPDLRQKLARALLRTGKAAEARRLFLQGAGEPSDQLSLRSLTALDLASEDYAAARARLERLLTLHPDADEERELYASVLQKLGQDAAAVAEYRRLLKKDPRRHETSWRLSRLHEEAKRGPEALKVLEEGLKAQPGQEMLEDARARLLFRQENWAGAEAAFSRMLLKEPKDGDSLLYRGLARLQARKLKEAEADFRGLEALDLGGPTQRYGLALSLLWQGRDAEAEKAFQALLLSYPKAVSGYSQLAFLYEKAGKAARAREVLEQGLKENPASGELHLLLGTSRMDKGEFAAAEKAFLRGIKDADDKVALRFQLAVLYDKDNRFPKAEALLKELIEEEPEHAQALNYLGYSWADRGLHLSEAEALIRRALKVEPDNHYYLDSLGWACFKNGKLEEAAAALEKAVAKPDPGPEEAVVFEHLGQVYEKLGRPEPARRQFERAKELKSPKNAKGRADGG